MPYSAISELPADVRNAIPSDDGKRMFMRVVNSSLADGRSEAVSFASAWAALQRDGYAREDGKWVKKADSYKLPEGARNNARKVLRWRQEHGDEVKGMTETGWRRARQLANNESVSAETVKAMAQFNRHRKNSEVASEHEGEPWKDAGYVAWLGWGGTTGIDWAIRTSERMEKRALSDDVFTTQQEAAERAAELGMDGTHVHDGENGQAAFMPGQTHEQYLAQIGGMADNEPDGMIERAIRAIMSVFVKGGSHKPQDVVKFDEERRIVWGWASVSTIGGELVYDTQGDSITPDELSKAADEFMLDVRVAKAMHEGGQVGEVIHSFPLTKELGDALGVASDREGWIIAMKIHDDEIWKDVKAGKLRAFSIGGLGERHAVE